jgi:hypothetical protein
MRRLELIEQSFADDPEARFRGAVIMVSAGFGSWSGFSSLGVEGSENVDF